MTETKMGRLVCSKIMNGEDTLLNISTVQGGAQLLVKLTPGIGKPFWYWPSIPVGRLVACDFSNAPIATGDTATNTALIAAITTLPTTDSP